MQFVFSGIVAFLSEDLAADDVDQLFEKLQKREPPLDIVKQILARIQQLSPGPQHPSSSLPADPDASPMFPVRPDQRGAGASH